MSDGPAIYAQDKRAEEMPEGMPGEKFFLSGIITPLKLTFPI